MNPRSNHSGQYKESRPGFTTPDGLFVYTTGKDTHFLFLFLFHPIPGMDQPSR